jgi:type VI secretion system protein ImpI/type VI secretion system protein
MPVTLRFQSTGAVPSNAGPVAMVGRSLTIGRAPENDLVLPDPERQLSKRHCAIEDHAGHVVVIDLSANGTFLNYGKVPVGRTPTPLSDGDILTLGAYELVVQITPGAARARPAASPYDLEPLPEPPRPHDLSILPPASAPPGRMAPAVPPADEESDMDFLDELLGTGTPKGHPQVRRADPGDDGRLPLLGVDDPGHDLPGPAQDTPAAASRFDQRAGVHDSFAAPVARGSIPDDWDDLLDGIALTGPGAAGPPPEAVPGPSATPPPSGLDITAPPAARPGPVGGDLAAREFLKALGAAHLALPDAELPGAMTRLGRAMRAMIAGVREVLMTRGSIKQEFRIETTMISSGGNNPLKFSVSPEQAVEVMVRPASPGWLEADVAAEQALRDMKAHEVAMLTGMEAALKGVLRRLDPAVLETTIERRGGLSTLLKGQKARYWEAYEKMYAEVAREAETDFHESFAREFARAYREQLDRLK